MAKETHFPDPPKGHIAVVGWDAANARWKAVAVDSSGLLQVDLADVADRQANVHGYDGSAWQKLPLLWGYTSPYCESVADTDLPGGSDNVDGSIVPAGEVWVVTHALIIYTGTPPTRVRVTAYAGGDYADLLRQLAPTSGQAYSWQGWVPLDEDGFLRASVAGATAHDVLEAFFAGFKMDVSS